MMSYKSKVLRAAYYGLPHPVKTAFATLYGFDQHLKRFSQDFWKTLDFLSECESWDNEKLLAYQNARVAEFVENIVRRVPFYRESPEYAGLRSSRSQDAAPILPKSVVRSHMSDLYSDDLAQLQPRWAHTSGTTGTALRFPLSSVCFRREHAFRTLHYRWCGVNAPSREPMAVCQGHPVTHPDRTAPPYWVKDMANNALFFSSYHLSAANLPAYAKALDSFQPVLLLGYPSSLYLLALAHQRYGKRPLAVKGVFTTSETLFPSQRQVIEEGFRARVFNAYGNSEMCAHVMECEHGELHLKHEHSLVEVVSASGAPAGPGESGRLICTGFGNLAFPLLRYDIGDVVRISNSQISKCGRGGLLLDQVLGRVEDYITGSDGRKVGRLDHLFKDSANVVEAQIVQNAPGEVVLRVVRAPDYGSRDEEAIRDEAALRLGSDTRVTFEYLPHLPRGKRNKFRFVINNYRDGAAPQEGVDIDYEESDQFSVE
jgi:phenylacetate-CoA ligase